jgi:hypothetical protein
MKVSEEDDVSPAEEGKLLRSLLAAAAAHGPIRRS